MVNKSQDSTNIRVTLKTKANLEAFGVYGETHSIIIDRLLFMAKNGSMAKKEQEEDRELGRLVK